MPGIFYLISPAKELIWFGMGTAIMDNGGFLFFMLFLLQAKDLNLAAESAKEIGVKYPLMSLAHEM